MSPDRHQRDREGCHDPEGWLHAAGVRRGYSGIVPFAPECPTFNDWRRMSGYEREELLRGLHRQKKSQWRDVHWLSWLLREALYRTIQCLPCDQYSSGNMRIVAERSASVRIQILSPALVVYADRMRNPCSTESSFSCLSASGTSPQSPLTCRSRNSAGSCSAFSKAVSAPGVATTRPNGKRIIGSPLVDACAGGTCQPADRSRSRLP